MSAGSGDVSIKQLTIGTLVFEQLTGKIKTIRAHGIRSDRWELTKIKGKFYGGNLSLESPGFCIELRLAILASR